MNQLQNFNIHLTDVQTRSNYFSLSEMVTKLKTNSS
jgi:hypothetical protein